MKSTLKILKNNIFTIVVIIVFIIGMFALSYLKKMYWDNNDQALYGDRVDGIENYEIDDKEKNKIIDNIKTDSDILEVVFDVEGRTINLTLTVNPELFEQIIYHPLTQYAIDDFDEDWRSVYGNKTVLDLCKGE